MTWAAFVVLAACLLVLVCGWVAGLDTGKHSRLLAIFWPYAFLTASIAACLVVLVVAS